MRGTNTLAAEVTHVSAHGLWVLLDAEELFLPFVEFPWFRSATIAQVRCCLMHAAMKSTAASASSGASENAAG